MADTPDDIDQELAKAFFAGIEASENYDAAMQQATAVIGEFAEGLNRLTSGKVTVNMRTTFIERARQLSNALLLALGPMPPERIQTHALYARGIVDNTQTREYQLCLIHLATLVFPIELEWPENVASCPTPQDLAVGLRKLVADAQVAKKLRIIMGEYDAMVAKKLGTPEEPHE